MSRLYQAAQESLQDDVIARADEATMRDAMHAQMLAQYVPAVTSPLMQEFWTVQFESLMNQPIDRETYMAYYIEAFDECATPAFTIDLCAQELLKKYYEQTLELEMEAFGVYKLDATLSVGDRLERLYENLEKTHLRQLERQKKKPRTMTKEDYLLKNPEYRALYVKKQRATGVSKAIATARM
ncbi:MAG: hypothetical protein H6765_06025 [Candidatus Peribacteria bacterium]|nr:MAG: hypothetical protein H6765_06025 [Candidatus Peribacteria bacterium]